MHMAQTGGRAVPDSGSCYKYVPDWDRQKQYLPGVVCRLRAATRQMPVETCALIVYVQCNTGLGTTEVISDGRQHDDEMKLLEQYRRLQTGAARTSCHTRGPTE
jgi:hypothetical protein